MENENAGMRLLKKGQGGLRQLLFGRMTVVLALLILQILLLVALFAWFEEYYLHYFGGSVVLAAGMVLHLQNKTMDPSARTSWLIIVMAAPVFGTFLYFYTNFEVGHRLLKKRVGDIQNASKQKIPQDPDTFRALALEDPGAASMCRFANRVCDAVVYENTEVTYFPLGQRKLERLLEELEKAEKFIYLEYFIVSEGVMWGRILEILARKAAQGVDVRLLYDGTCEFILLPKDYPQKLRALGIQCKVFSPISPFVSTHYNYRDHRKILVIDGHTAFNGGINLSDEYINIGSRFGQWKDTAVMLKGEAVRGFTLMFLQMWNIDRREPEHTALSAPVAGAVARGYVMPFGNIPLDSVKMGQTVYTDMLNRARERVCIMTPYLMIDSEMENALCYAAARGVRVRLLLPGIPDKRIPYALAKSHCRPLLEAGVEIYEYTPGFVHAKVVAVDGQEAVVGTINFDYRSFWHHFECGTYMHGCDCIADIEADFEECLSVSRRVSVQTLKKEKWYMKLTAYLLKGFEPLL